MHPDDVQAIGLQTLQAVFNRAHRRIGAVIVNDFVRTTVLEHPALLTQITGGGVFDFVEDDSADLAAQHVIVTVVLGQRSAQADLRQARAVKWRGVEIAHAGIPCSMDRRLCLFFRNRAEHVAQGRGAKTECTGQFVFQTHDSILVMFRGR